MRPIVVRLAWIAPVIVLAAACQEYDFGKHDKSNDTNTGEDTDYSDAWDDIQCQDAVTEDRDVGVTDTCDFKIGGFEPVVRWEAGKGMSAHAQPVVGDLDGDGMPEIVVAMEDKFIEIPNAFGVTGELVALRSDGSVAWTAADADIGSGSSPAIADLDGDGVPEIVAVRTVVAHSAFECDAGDYRVVAWNNEGTEIWESPPFQGGDFDQSTSLSVADMDGDGDPEIIAGRVILHSDGSVRGVGTHGHGSYGMVEIGKMSVCEGAVSGVADLDLDGTMEVVVGDAIYDPDGKDLWSSASAEDGMISIANLDPDPEGEFVAITHNTVLARDTDGELLWGPVKIGTGDYDGDGQPDGNIAAPAGIQDLDGDGLPEIVTAAGSEIVALHYNGTELWRVHDLGSGRFVQDLSGATGASFFDFEGDGEVEVVYIDEKQLVALNGRTGALKFWSDKHSSNTLFDYPTIADIDADGHADILVANVGAFGGYALTAFRDATNSWAPARTVLNQHQYSITNIYDDLTVPTDTAPNFERFNSWHSAVDRDPSNPLEDDLEAELLGMCSDDCDAGAFHIVGRVLNRSPNDFPAGIPLTLYAEEPSGLRALRTVLTEQDVASGRSGEPIEFDIPPAELVDADALWLYVDDGGHGGGTYPECSEANNGVRQAGPFCP